MTKDDIGDRGQRLVELLLTELCGRDVPYFRPRFLGDKYPVFDLIVEVVDNPAYFFFAQVKATTEKKANLESWRWFALGALGVMMAEWWWFHRRTA